MSNIHRINDYTGNSNPNRNNQGMNNNNIDAENNPEFVNIPFISKKNKIITHSSFKFVNRYAGKPIKRKQRS